VSRTGPPCVHTGSNTRYLDDYHCSAEVRGSFHETVPRKTGKNTVKHHDGSVGLVVANHRDGSESSVVV